MSEDGVLGQYLEQCEKEFNPKTAMIATVLKGVGYHTRLPDGTTVHDTRGSLQYALAILQSADPALAPRAEAIIDRILTLQDTDPFSPTYGIWSWFYEEPLNKMSPPDWNWADFLGAYLAQMLAHHTKQLPTPLQARMRAALGHAAMSIFRRNVTLDYTNIAIMGGGVAAAAGELLSEPRLLDYGRERLRRVVERTGFHGSLPEYNSPNYTLVALDECERILHIVRDPGVREAAEQLRRIVWQIVAEHWHPRLQQWTGPNSRAYQDRLNPGTARCLREHTGLPIQPHPSQSAASGRVSPSLIPPVPCPTDLLPRFSTLPAVPYETTGRLVRLNGDRVRPEERERTGTVWFAEDACLSSVNHDDLWNQRRPLLAYWSAPGDPAVVLRLRFLRDGRDFASIYVRNAQQGPRVLSLFSALSDHGDFHCHLDRPADGIFHTRDLRLRYELTGVGANAAQIAPGLFALGAGLWRAAIHTVTGQFGAQTVRWESGQDATKAWVDAICYSGPEQAIHFPTLSAVRLAAGLELLRTAESPLAAPPTLSPEAACVAEWAGLRLSIPAPVESYPS